MTTPKEIQAALDEISETLHTLLDRCPRQAYDDLGKSHQSAQSRVDDLRELQSHAQEASPVDTEALKAEVRAWRYPEGHSGIPDKVYMQQHKSDASLIDELLRRGFIQDTKGE